LAVNPASAKANKQWSAENFAVLLDAAHTELNLPGVLVTADKTVAEAVQQAAKQPFVNLAGRTDLKQLAAVLRRSAVHVCGDTGSAHLAAALGRPVVTLIGPTDPDRVGPYGQRENVISHREVCDAACTGITASSPRPAVWLPSPCPKSSPHPHGKTGRTVANRERERSC
jgi:ADP-heptose:LPS heptosyltransferase